MACCNQSMLSSASNVSLDSLVCAQDSQEQEFYLHPAILNGFDYDQSGSMGALIRLLDHDMALLGTTDDEILILDDHANVDSDDLVSPFSSWRSSHVCDEPSWVEMNSIDSIPSSPISNCFVDAIPALRVDTNIPVYLSIIKSPYSTSVLSTSSHDLHPTETEDWCDVLGAIIQDLAGVEDPEYIIQELDKLAMIPTIPQRHSDRLKSDREWIKHPQSTQSGFPMVEVTVLPSCISSSASLTGLSDSGYDSTRSSLAERIVRRVSKRLSKANQSMKRHTSWKKIKSRCSIRKSGTR